jgi:ABC-type nitrate/sulfonate/bicarbonate transport system substrate-binding protein
LRRRHIPIRVFRVDRFGAPPYPELVLCASKGTLRRDPELASSVVRATELGYRFAVERPAAALEDLLEAVPSLDRSEQEAQLRELRPAIAPARFDPEVLRRWAAWDLEHGILGRPLSVRAAFDLLPPGVLG